MAAQRAGDSRLNLLEHFILKEDKLPGCLLFSEARAEAAIAAMVQTGMSKDGEGIPHLPFPLVCVRLPEVTAESAVREIAARVLRSLWPKIEMLAATGLGAYVYWYPSLPLRARHFAASRELAIPMSEGWISLAARLLRAGFLPTTAHSLGRGHCCDLQNSVVDGGFADLSSVVPVADVTNRQDVFIALQMTIWRLATTILHVLGKDGIRSVYFDYRGQKMLHVVRERLASAHGTGANVNFLEFFGAAENLDSVARFLDQA
jgi:hypothetical protein